MTHQNHFQWKIGFPLNEYFCGKYLLFSKKKSFFCWKSENGKSGNLKPKPLNNSRFSAENACLGFWAHWDENDFFVFLFLKLFTEENHIFCPALIPKHSLPPAPDKSDFKSPGSKDFYSTRGVMGLDTCLQDLGVSAGGTLLRTMELGHCTALEKLTRDFFHTLTSTQC